ncbi:MAG: hypothetical protein D6798_10380 [Deltaproteobacteria bacterium]|nr:MAG: hypothetical protein D6798_10380 [Deltaproteobacteria bacterium]
MSHPHLTGTPSRDFWLGELRLAEYDRLLGLLGDPARLRAEVESAYASPGARRVLEQAHEEHGEGPALDLNLLLVSVFLRLKKSSAVGDVAWAGLPRAVVVEHISPGGRVQRLPLAALLYIEDPFNLLAILVCHHWHSRRRCALEREGPRRRLPSPMESVDWPGLGESAVADLKRRKLGVNKGFVFRLALFRKDRSEALLAFSEPARLSTVRDLHGVVRAGTHDHWTLLRFHQEAARVDVTSADLDAGRILAESVATRLWGKPITYRPARKPLTGDTLDELLRLLRNPDNDVWRLLELDAVLPGLPDCPLVTLGNSGQTRIEPAVQEIRRHMAFADHWQTVHRVKIGFNESYRITVHFPRPEDELVLTYSDLDRDKDITEEFEALFADELGVEIHPKSGRSPSRKRTEPPKPRRFGVATWAALLRPVQDDPASWEVDAVRALAEEGLVEMSEHAVFRCGDPNLNRRHLRADTLDCHGVIEMPYGEADPADPYRQEDDAQFTCGVCEHVWYPGRYRLPTTHRVRVRPRPLAVWRYLLDELARKGAEFQEEAPGVAFGLYRGRVAYLVLLGTAEDEQKLDPAWSAAHPCCWVALGDAQPRYADRCVTLAAVLADGVKVVTQALTVDGSIAGAAYPVPAVAATPSVVAEPERPARRYITRDDKGIWLDGNKLARSTAEGVGMALALLHHAAQLDDGVRQRRTGRRLAELTGTSEIGEVLVTSWMSRLRAAIRKKVSDEPGLADQVVDHDRDRGYRLGAGFTCSGFDLTEQVRNCQVRIAERRSKADSR